MKDRPRIVPNWAAVFVIAGTLGFWILIGMSLKGCTQ